MNCPISGKPCLKYKGFHVTEKKDGKTNSYSVCEDCLHTESATAKIEAVVDKNSCSNCGVTLNDILKGSRMGCAKCYDNFDGTLEHMLAALHNVSKAKHTGGIPLAWKVKQAEETNPVTFLAELNQEMDEIIYQEKYEQVGKIKKDISDFNEILFRYKNADESQAPPIKKELVNFIYEYRERSAI